MDCKTRKRVLFREYVNAMLDKLLSIEAERKIRHMENLYPDFPFIYEEEYGERNAETQL